jgi:hypothetical protein
MDSFKINLSLNDYFAPTNEKLRVAANALCKVLQGKDMPQTNSMAEARAYNRALALAAQLRADYVEMLFDVWSMTFGRELEEKFSGRFIVEYESEYRSINDIWENDDVYNAIFVKGLTNSGKEDIFELYVEFDEGIIYLSVFKYSRKDEDYLDFEFSTDPDQDEILWEVQENEDDNTKFMSSAGVSIAKLIESPATALVKLRQEAATVLAFIAETHVR